jgi:TPR repeat protein
MPTVGPYQRPNSPTRPRNNGVPALTAVFPSIKSLTEARGVTDPAGQVAWAKDVIWLVEKSQSQGGASAPTGQIRLSDPQLQSLADQAVSMILRVAPSPPLQSPPPYIVEAVFLRGKLSSTGWFPDLVPHNPREAFRYFEASARAGYSMGWFHLGRDYEGVGDSKRALDCFERGVKTGSEHCLYVRALELPRNHCL